MSKAKQELLDQIESRAYEVLLSYQPRRMTLRQIFYRMLGDEFANTTKNYNLLGDALTRAKKAKRIPWEWIEDRTRLPRIVPQWTDPKDFLASVIPQYRRDRWSDQPRQVEVWLEKETLAPLFEAVLAKFGVTLTVGHGWSSWSSDYDLSQRLGSDGLLLFFSDFDPSGEGMLPALQKHLKAIGGAVPEMRKVALTLEQIERFSLPSMPCKDSDNLAASHRERYGDRAVELDALEPEDLEKLTHDLVSNELDPTALQRTLAQEEADRVVLATMLEEEDD